jgi:hypothetical protein
MADTVDIGECALFLKILLGKAEAGFVKGLLDLVNLQRQNSFEG